MNLAVNGAQPPIYIVDKDDIDRYTKEPAILAKVFFPIKRAPYEQCRNKAISTARLFAASAKLLEACEAYEKADEPQESYEDVIRLYKEANVLRAEALDLARGIS